MTENRNLTGEILEDRYHLDKILGRGSFGAAYLAQDIRLQRACVVKQMLIPDNKSTTQVSDYHNNFEREAGLLVQLNHPGHPNIPEIYDYFSDRGGNYLVMKYIEGRSLKTLQQEKEGRLAWRNAVQYIIEVASALEYMHAMGEQEDGGPREPVIHRDIKPDNILLGNDGRVWLVDFGLAKAKPIAGAGAEDLALTQASGSLGYSPLEQWLGEPVPASDIYALGATLHHLITGQNPGEAFQDGFDFAKLEAQHGQFSALQSVDKAIPKGLTQLIAKATAAKPEDRPTASQFRQQLEALISNPQTAALYTFKSGESAHTVPELVTLCEKYPREAQDYLTNGEFASWFRIINRNDLAEAAQRTNIETRRASQNLKYFLKLILPNLWLRRLRQWLWRFFKFGTALGSLGAVILLTFACTLFVVGAFTIQFMTAATVGNYTWNFSRIDPNGPNQLTEDDLNMVVDDFLYIMPGDIDIDLSPTNTVRLSSGTADLGTLRLSVNNNVPQFTVPPAENNWLIANIVTGLNTGIRDTFTESPYDIESLSVTEEAVFYTASPSGRAPLPEVNEQFNLRPMIGVFNERDEAVRLEIGEESWLIEADDSKAIELTRGTYDYRILNAETDSLLEFGEKTWHEGSYRWYIDD